MEAELFQLDGDTDGQTDTHCEANSHLQFCKLPKNHKKSLEF